MADLPDDVMTCQHFQQVDRVADEYWQQFRQVGLGHLDYFLGRHYGISSSGIERPLNLMAQHVRAFMPKLVPARFAHYCEPRAAGLELEALAIKRLLERDDKEQDIIENVYEPMLMEPFFYPLSVSYLGLRPSRDLIDMQGVDIDQGEPFVLHIPFWQWSCDHFATDFRSRGWERHRYRVDRRWLLESPAYADVDRDVLAAIPCWEDSQDGKQQHSWLNSSSSMPDGGSGNAMSPTVELMIVVFYRADCVIEATCTRGGRGPSSWLRAVKYSGPDGGPYDHLTYQGIPGMLAPAALLNFTRDIAENADALARKNQWSALNSKVVMCYQSGAEDEAKALMENPHGTMLSVDDPGLVKTHEMKLLSAEGVAMQEQVTNQWDEAAGNPRQLAQGDRKGQNTATQADISNARVGEQVQYLVNKINRLATHHSRKRAWYFQTNPAANEIVDVRGGDGTIIELAYTAENRQGTPDDFGITSESAGGQGASPEVALRKALEIMQAITVNMPLFQAGIFDLGQFLRFCQRKGVDGIDEFSGDISMVQERMIADQAAQSFHDFAETGQAPGMGMGGGEGGPPGAPPPGTGGKQPVTSPGAMGGGAGRRPAGSMA